MNSGRAPRPVSSTRLAGAALLLITLIPPSFAQTAKPALKPLDVFDLQWVSDPQIAPDGRSIAYVRMSFDIKTDRPQGAVWLTGADGKGERPLSSAAASSAPRWSPDGLRLAYLGMGADGSTQLFIYWIASGATAAINSPTWSITIIPTTITATSCPAWMPCSAAATSTVSASSSPAAAAAAC
jgi:hypothetical protein